MRNYICTFLLISFIAAFGAISASAQVPSYQVEANIPFDFTIGKQNFTKGSYEMRLTRVNGALFRASLLDDAGTVLMTTTAIQIGSTNRDNSDMLFSGNEGHLSLNKLRTPDLGFQFAMPKLDRALVAKSKQVPVQTTGSPN